MITNNFYYIGKVEYYIYIYNNSTPINHINLKLSKLKKI